jgi:hypothetical protein
MAAANFERDNVNLFFAFKFLNNDPSVLIASFGFRPGRVAYWLRLNDGTPSIPNSAFGLRQPETLRGAK